VGKGERGEITNSATKIIKTGKEKEENVVRSAGDGVSVYEAAREVRREPMGENVKDA